MAVGMQKGAGLAFRCPVQGQIGIKEPFGFGPFYVFQVGVDGKKVKKSEQHSAGPQEQKNR